MQFARGFLCRPIFTAILGILLCALMQFPAQAQVDSYGVEVASGQIASMVMPPTPARAAGDKIGSGRRIHLGMPTTSQYQSSRSGGDTLGLVYTANPELQFLLPNDFVIFQAPTGEVFSLRVAESRATRFGNLEISGGDDSASFFAIVSKTGDFIADIETRQQTYRAFIGDGLTFVFSSDDPSVSKGIIADDTPLDGLLNQVNFKRMEVPPSPKLGSRTVIALGILLDNFWWQDDATLTMLDYYIGNLNQAYQAANVDIKFEISAIGNYEPYKEPFGTSGDLGPTLKWITCGTKSCQPLDGVNTAVDNWRSAKKVDVVVQILQHPAVTTPNEGGSYSINWGIAQLPMSDLNLSDPSVLKQYTYSVSGIYNPYNSSPAGKYLVAHEVGHNLGLWHDRETLENQIEDSWTVVKPFMRYTYGIGYRFGDESGTTMSYAPNNVNILSTPDVSVNGIPVGVPIGEPMEAFSAQAVANIMGYYRAVFNNAPSAPTITSVQGGDGEIFVSFSAGSTGGLAVTSYTATCSDGQSMVQSSGTSSPITVAGVSNDVTYVCEVVATNPDGSSAPSEASMPVTPEETVQGLPIWLLYEASQ